MRSPARWKAASTLAAFGLAAVLLYFSLRGIDWRGVWKLLGDAKPGKLAIACAIATFGLFLRAARWRILLCAERPVRMYDAFWATCAGYFGNNFLPARAGELIRTYIIHTNSGLSTAYVLTTALAERFADAITLVTISAVALLTLPEQPDWLVHASKPFAILGICGILGLALAPRFSYIGDGLIDRLLPRPVREKMHSILDHVIRGIRAFHDVRRLAGFGAMTLVIWSNDALFTVIVARAVDLKIEVPVAFLLLAGLGLASALPSTPGYVGIYQFVAVSVLVPFGISRTDAIGYIVLSQALQYLVVGSLGAVGFWKVRKKSFGNIPYQPLRDPEQSLSHLS
ncbi:MAG: lysylphosphatidylglycerol synthase transmembrane domain-containing protein [Bryobacteraceae bacterium]